MAESLEALQRQGLVSNREAKRVNAGSRARGPWPHGPKGTKTHPSKMADFDDESKVDEHLPHVGVVKPNAINEKSLQKHGPKMSKGGSVNRTGQPRHTHIDDEQHPMYPPEGAKMRPGKWKSHRAAEPNPPRNPNQYSGRNSRP